MNLAVDRFYQAEPELRQGKGELFLWEVYKTEFLTRYAVRCNQVIVQLWQCLLLLFKIAHKCC